EANPAATSSVSLPVAVTTTMVRSVLRLREARRGNRAPTDTVTCLFSPVVAASMSPSRAGAPANTSTNGERFTRVFLQTMESFLGGGKTVAHQFTDHISGLVNGYAPLGAFCVREILEHIRCWVHSTGRTAHP